MPVCIAPVLTDELNYRRKHGRQPSEEDSSQAHNRNGVTPLTSEDIRPLSDFNYKIAELYPGDRS